MAGIVDKCEHVSGIARLGFPYREDSLAFSTAQKGTAKYSPWILSNYHTVRTVDLSV